MKDNEIKELIKNYPQQNFNISKVDPKHPLSTSNPLYREMYNVYLNNGVRTDLIDEKIENNFIGLTDFQYRAKAIAIFKFLHPDLFEWFFPNSEDIQYSGDRTQTRWYSNNLLTSDLGQGFTSTDILKFTELMPGTMIRIVFAKDGEYNQSNEDNYKDIVIGATGNYYADNIEPVYGIYLMQSKNRKDIIMSNLNNNLYLDFNSESLLNLEDAGNSVVLNDKIPILQPNNNEGMIFYQYKVPIRNSFDSIADIEIDIGANKQFVGPVEDLVAFLDCTKEQVTKISMSRYFKRPVEYLFYQGQDLINFSENVFTSGYINNFKSLVPAYEGKLYWDTNYTGTFDEKEHREYSPFSIYVLRNSYVTANGEKQNIINHIKHSIEETGETHTHVANHMFEKYYIDRYINAQTAEDMLTERMALVARIAASTDEEEKQILQDALVANPLYVLDPIAGKMYKAGENYTYNPTIVYNNEPIDLREIQRYDLDNLEPTESKIFVGNGVYGDVFYQKVTMKYSFEETDDNLLTIKNTYYNELARLKNLRKEGKDPSRAELEKLDEYYNNYNSILAETIKNWTTRETDLEEE